MRNILIYSTTGKNGITVASDATTWEALQKALDQNDVTHKNMKAIIGQSRLTLESPLAVLPIGDFTLFLMPKKTKSGNDYKDTPYKECRTIIKGVIEVNGDEAKRFFSDGTKNYTQTTTDYMRKRIAAWFKKFGAATPASVEAVEAVVESVKESKKVKAKITEVIEEVTPESFVEGVINGFDNVDDTLFDDLTLPEDDAKEAVLGALETFLEMLIEKRINAEKVAKEAAEEAEIQRRVDAELAKRTKALDDQAEQMRKEFGDLR